MWKLQSCAEYMLETEYGVVCAPVVSNQPITPMYLPIHACLLPWPINSFNGL